MRTAALSPPTIETLADLLDRLGGVPPERIRFRPYPGTATEADVLAALEAPDKRLYELVDGVLVEKAMGSSESILAAWLMVILDGFVRPPYVHVFPAHHVQGARTPGHGLRRKLGSRILPKKKRAGEGHQAVMGLVQKQGNGQHACGHRSPERKRAQRRHD